jgi:hypothetical protein
LHKSSTLLSFITGTGMLSLLKVWLNLQERGFRMHPTTIRRIVGGEPRIRRFVNENAAKLHDKRATDPAG